MSFAIVNEVKRFLYLHQALTGVKSFGMPSFFSEAGDGRNFLSSDSIWVLIIERFGTKSFLRFGYESNGPVRQVGIYERSCAGKH